MVRLRYRSVMKKPPKMLDGPDGRPRDEAWIRLFEAIRGLGEAEIWGSVQTCIEAAMQSMAALDRVSAPLVVTNIHATAHA